MKFTLKVFLAFSKVLCKKNTQRLSHHCDSYTISCTFFSISKKIHFHCMTFVLKIICQIKFVQTQFYLLNFMRVPFFIDAEIVIDDQMLDKNISNETGKRVFEKQVFGNKKVDLILF